MAHFYSWGQRSLQRELDKTSWTLELDYDKVVGLEKFE